MNIWQNLANRIPHSLMALLLGTIAARAYLQFIKDKTLKSLLIDKLWGFLLLYLLITRFSGFLLHPSTLVNLNLYILLAQPPVNGWLIGLVVASVYLVFTLRRAGLANRSVFYIISKSLLLAALPYFLYSAIYNFAPFFQQDLLRLGIASLILLINLPVNLRTAFQRDPHRLWLIMGVSMLATSVIVPQVDQWGLFSPEQWVDTALILMALGIEGIKDIVNFTS